MIILLLTIFEISLTLWSVFEIAKGATFHQLNSLHLKYSAVFSEEVFSLENGAPIEFDRISKIIASIRQQPVECLEQVNVLNKLIMRQIGTYHALELCEKDIRDADHALNALNNYQRGLLDRHALVTELESWAHVFNENSALFEKPITRTVSFVMSSMIPLVIVISFFNIIFIAYMSRNITGSINGVIRLLSKENSRETLSTYIDKNVTGELRTLLDVTKERLTNEIMMNEVNQKLESLVEHRTQSLTRANEELAQFAYRASHDLKAPLTSTKCLAGFIVEDIEAGKLDYAKADAEKIAEQMITLERLVTSILSLTETDHPELGQEEINFQQLLSDIRVRCQSLLDSSGCQFETEIQLKNPVLSQPIRILQILENLIVNGIKYCDPIKRKPFVRASIRERDDCHIIQIEDNGLGIPENRSPELFQMFKRFHPDVSFGSGLGLSIVKKHVDCLHAIIDVKSSNKGTTISIKLPKEVAV